MSDAVRKEPEVRAVCPITKGLTVRMTEPGFASACAAALVQAREAVKSNNGLPLAAARISRCLRCLGIQRPPELQVVDLEFLKTERGSVQREKEFEMSGKRLDGTCENCGRENMTLTKLHGDLVCASCGNLFGAMANRPEAVKKALSKMLPQFLASEASDSHELQKITQRCDELAAEVQALSNQLVDEQELRKKKHVEADHYWSDLIEIGETLDPNFEDTANAATVPTMVRDRITALQSDKTNLQNRIERLTDENTVLVNQVSDLEKRLEDLEDWEKVPTPGLAMEHGYEYDLIRDQLASFALKVLQGQVGIVHREA